MYEQILYPTDGSDGSEAAIAHVREMAEAFDATVHVLHVVDTRQFTLGIGGNYITGPMGYTTDQPSQKDRKRKLEERARPFVEEVAADFEGIDAVSVVREGNPHKVILEYIEENDIDLVVMGAEGRTGVERYLLGSVSERVVRLSDAPVVTVRAEAEEE